MIWQKPDSWEEKFALAKRYYEEHGDLNVPPRDIAHGVWLNKWLNEQKQIYAGNRAGKSLTEEQVQRLESIGMHWCSKSRQMWNEQYKRAVRFYQENGHLIAPKDYLTEDGTRLNVWIQRQRAQYQAGKLTDDQIALLEEIGMVWNPAEEKWRECYEHTKEYLSGLDKTKWSSRYVSPGGYKTGAWLRGQQRTA